MPSMKQRVTSRRRPDESADGEVFHQPAARDLAHFGGISLPDWLGAADRRCRVVAARVDEQGHTHIRYAQTKNGLLVVGGEFGFPAPTMVRWNGTNWLGFGGGMSGGG